MARTQAKDYKQRREAILDHAAKLYSSHGYLGSSIADIASSCKISKSLIYYYHGSKEDILFELMRTHAQAVLDTIQAMSERKLQPQAKVRELTRQLLGLLFHDRGNRHRVLVTELHQLPASRRKIIVNMEREMVALVGTILAEVRPAKRLLEQGHWPVTMMFVGMLNWTYTWLDPEGPLSLEQIADIAAEIMLNGLAKARLPV